jgi:hypothetical protein
MKQFFCPVCKAPIVCTYEKPDFYFYQDENNNIVRDTNEDPINGTHPHLHFHCSDDMEDNIKPLDSLDEFIKWKKEYKESILTILLKERLII